MPPPRVANQFHAIRRIAIGATRFGQSLAAATLSLDELRRDIRNFWDEVNRTDVDSDEGLTPWEQQCVEQLIPRGSSVLLVGCSNGRELIPLMARGCVVVGVDPSPCALTATRQALGRRGMPAELLAGFIEDVDLSGTFDVVWFGGLGSYSFIPESERRVRVLRKVAARLRPGGRIIVSYAHLPRPRLWMIRGARAASWMSRSDWRPEPGDYLTRRRIGATAHFTFHHAFRPDEIEREAAAAGMQVVFRQGAHNTLLFSLGPATA